MVVIAAAVLVVIAQAYAAETGAARRRAAALQEARTQAEEASLKALEELERIRILTAEQLVACQESTEQAQAAARAARAELEKVRDVAAAAVSDVQQAVHTAIRKGIIDRDRILAERATDQCQQAKYLGDDTVDEIDPGQDQLGGAQAADAQMVKAFGIAGAAHAGIPAESHRAMVAQQSAPSELASTRPRSVPARRASKMTPALVDEIQRMYDSGRYAVAEIARTFAVSPTTIYRHLRTRRTT